MNGTSTSQSPQAPATRVSFERRWAISSLRGNEAFATGRRELARMHYLESLRLAQQALGLARRDDATQPDETVDYWISIWVLSHLNLADLHAHEGQFARAIELVFAAYEEVVCCLHDTGVSARVHRACLGYLRPVLDGLRDLMDGAGLPQRDKDRVIAKAQALALGYWEVWT